MSEKTPIPIILSAPWAHRGNGVVVDNKRRVLGAFERSSDALAAIAAVNAIFEMTDRSKDQTHG